MHINKRIHQEFEFENNRVMCLDLFLQYIAGISFIMFLKEKVNYKIFTSQKICLIFEIRNII